MCGIAGLFLTSVDAFATAAERNSIDAALRHMVEHLAHRGPDDQGTEVIQTERGRLALGHTRLSILDLSPAGHQPMVDAHTGNWITYNGEIYNFHELRQQLTDTATDWQSQSDTEVILRAYSRWGKNCVNHLRGMFAFALWDARRQELFIARDRLGIKPLYYYADDKRFLFASEVGALLASDFVPRQLDPVALWQYLAYQSVPAPRTMIQNVCALAPGSWLVIAQSGRVTQGHYWDLLENAALEAREASLDECRKKIGELLHEAVALHLVSDVPVAAFLSGGIDSSAIVALMREAGQTPQTFSVAFAEKNFDETPHSRLIAARFQTDHTEIHLTRHDLLVQLPDALAAMDQPTGDAVNTYVVSRAVSQAGIKVALSGLGGDEFFAGYPSFSRLSRVGNTMRAWGGLPSAVKNFAASAIASLAGDSIAVAKATAMLKSDGRIATMYPGLRQVLSDTQRRAILNDAWLHVVAPGGDYYSDLLEEAFAAADWAGPLTQISYAEARTYMHDVLLRDTDQMSMAHSLEVRVPLLDHKLIEYVMGIADAHKRPNGTPKRLLVESLNGLLPDEIVHRPKQGFTFPFALWMRGELQSFCEQRLNEERIAARGLFKPRAVSNLWRNFLAGRHDVSWSRLWILVVLEEWLEQNRIVTQLPASPQAREAS